MMKPKLPLHVIFEDGDRWVLNNEEEIACSLEWYDSNDEDDTTKVIDDLGRPVKLIIEPESVMIEDCDCLRRQQAVFTSQYITGQCSMSQHW